MTRKHGIQTVCAHAGNRRCGAFTTIEVMMVLIIMGIVATIGMDSIANFDASARPERAARECLIAFRYARQLAVTTGKSAKVTFNTASNAWSVYWMSNGTTWDATPVAQPAAQGGSYTVTMNSTAELNGVTLSLNPAGTTAFTYNSLGSLDNSTVITFTFGPRSRTLTVPKAGDPVIN